MRRNFLFTLALLSLGACDTATRTNDQGYLKTVPEGVLSIADPRQDLTQVVLLEEDNCYWYSHAGPVETTLLPLRTSQGRPICAPKPATEETTAG